MLKLTRISLLERKGEVWEDTNKADWRFAPEPETGFLRTMRRFGGWEKQRDIARAALDECLARINAAAVSGRDWAIAMEAHGWAIEVTSNSLDDSATVRMTRALPEGV